MVNCCYRAINFQELIKRNLVLRCSNHPFSYDDWFIGNTVVNRGVPNKIKEMTINFEFNNIKA